MRATIEADHVLPNLLELTKEILFGMGVDAEDGDIEQSLQSVDHLSRLSTLSTLYAHHSDAQTLLDGVERWSKRRALWSVVFVLPFLYVVAALGVTPFPWPRVFTLVAGAIALVGASIALTSWFQESFYRNRFANLCKTYE